MNTPPCYHLLEQVVLTEKASVVHWGNCPICNPVRGRNQVALCTEGKSLASKSITAMLEATLFIDKSQLEGLPPCCDPEPVGSSTVRS